MGEAVRDDDQGGVRILLVASDPEAGQRLATAIRDEGYSAVSLDIGDEALRLAAREIFDIMIVDLNVEPDFSAAEAVRAFKAAQLESAVIMTGVETRGESRAKALRAGAFQCLTSPVYADELIFEIGRALEYRELVRQNKHLRQQVVDHSQPAELVGGTAAMVAARKRIAQSTHSRSPVLIQGERGTGKRLVARIVHCSGPRKGQPFVAIDCHALPGALLGSELFGPTPGSSGGMRCGALEEASGGTVYLEEVGAMDRKHQEQLLRVLEEHRVQRPANGRVVPVDVRIIAASTSNLADQVKKGGFRQDLFFRLRVVEITLPPLRERIADVVPLALHFLKKHEQRSGKQYALSAEALTMLQTYSWPGNVRELEQALESAIALNRSGVLQLMDFPQDMWDDFHPGVRLERLYAGLPSLRELGERYLAYVLRFTGGKKAQTAAILGISRKTLYIMADRAGKRILRRRKSP